MHHRAYPRFRCVRASGRYPGSPSIGVLYASIGILLDRGDGLIVLSVCSVCNSRRTNPADCADEHAARRPTD